MGNHFVPRCNADQRTRNTANRCALRAYNAVKCDSGRGFASDPAVRASIAPSDPLAGFEGAASRRGEGGGKGIKRRKREERDREGRLTLMRSWNVAAGSLRRRCEEGGKRQGLSVCLSVCLFVPLSVCLSVSLCVGWIMNGLG